MSEYRTKYYLHNLKWNLGIFCWFGKYTRKKKKRKKTNIVNPETDR